MPDKFTTTLRLTSGVRALTRGKSIALFAIMALLALQILAAWSGPTLAKASTTSDAALDATWTRTDQPVKQGLTSRTWIWGPQINKTGTEMYKESPGGFRQVHYYDKSRMEVNDPNASTSSKWYVTNGLLVKEMISGLIQVGDNSFVPYQVSQEAIAGDPASVNTNAPTYLSLRPFASLENDNRAQNRAGQIIKERLYKAGTYDIDSSYNSFNVTAAYYDPTLGHNIPNVFMQFFSLQGPVVENSKTVTGTVFDWIYAAGLPLTEPYWTKVKVSGLDKDVLVQAFERRVLTYTPSNPDGFQVEMGNVGLHYVSWRYGTDGKDKADPANNGGVTPAPGSEVTPVPGNNGGGNNGGGNTTPTPGSGGDNTTPTPGSGGGNTTPTPGGGTGGTPTATTAPTVDGDISISVGGPVDLPIGGTASVGINVGSLNGYTGPVTLSVNGGIPGVNASLSATTVNLPANGTAGVTLNLSAGTNVNPGNINLTVTASAGNKSHSAGVNVNLKVPGTFNLSAGAGVSLKVGQVAHTTVNLQAVDGFSGNCTLSTNTTGIGLSANVSPSVTLGVNGSANADVTISASAPISAGLLAVTATCNGVTKTVNLTVAASVL